MVYRPNSQRYIQPTKTWGRNAPQIPEAQSSDSGKINANVPMNSLGGEDGYFSKLFGGGGVTGGEVEAGSGLVSEGSAGGGSSAGGSSAAGIGGIVAAAIAAQHVMSNNTKTNYEGVETDDAFGGHFGNEPWLAFAHDKLDLAPTAGEKFDAAVENSDWNSAFRRSFEMSDYWADPGSSWMESGAQAVGVDDEVAGWMFNPFGELTGLIGD